MLGRWRGGLGYLSWRGDVDVMAGLWRGGWAGNTTFGRGMDVKLGSFRGRYEERAHGYR